MSEYIERDYLLKRVHDVVFSYKPPRIPKGEAEHIIKMFLIEESPAADVAPVVHGRWLDSKISTAYKICSECGFNRDIDFDFGAAVSCPNCGCKMDKEAQT